MAETMCHRELAESMQRRMDEIQRISDEIEKDIASLNTVSVSKLCAALVLVACRKAVDEGSFASHALAQHLRVQANMIEMSEGDTKQ